MLRSTQALVATMLAAGALALLSAAPAAAQSGGVSGPGTPPPAGPPGKAKLTKSGKAIPPRNAPARIKRAIRAGNRIRKRPYVYGGGHRSFKSRGYDCSGAVSYVLHAAGVLPSPLASGGLMRWGKRGRGKWITVYAHGGHTYLVIAGLRWDTSSVNDSRSSGKGPRWRKKMRSPRGFRVRHARGL